jgi:20S proteasome subunit alpha 7
MGVRCKDGIIIGSEKIVSSKMQLPSSDGRIWSITKHIGVTGNGLVPDAKSLMFRGREEHAQYEKMYGIKMPGKILSDRLAQQVHLNTIYAGKRPYGTSVILSCYDELYGATLWMIEPSGACYEYMGCATGRGKQLCRNEVEKKNYKDMTCEEALPHATKILLKAQEEMKDKQMQVEIGVLSQANNWVHKIIDAKAMKILTDQAAKEIEEEEMDLS